MPVLAGIDGRLEEVEDGTGYRSHGCKVIDTDFPPIGFIGKLR